MKNASFFLVVCLCVIGAIAVGMFRDGVSGGAMAESSQNETIPHIGSIEILNGCGADGAAAGVAEFLRQRKFDVKNIDNADSWNYPHTIVASRVKDMSVAREVAEALHTDRVILLRIPDTHYDVTIILGNDWQELIQ